MPANLDPAEIRERSVRQNAELRHRAAAPRRHKYLTVCRERDAIGIMIGGKPLRDLARRGVHHREPIADILGDINEFSVGRERQSRRIACARAVLRLCLCQFELVLERGRAVFPRIDEEHVGVAAGDAEVMAVGREGGAVECAILEQRLRDLPRLQIDDLNALLAPAAEHNHGSVLFRREYEIDRQAAEVDRIADGIESHTGRQRRSEERRPLSGHRRAGQCKEPDDESTDA